MAEAVMMKNIQKEFVVGVSSSGYASYMFRNTRIENCDTLVCNVLGVSRISMEYFFKSISGMRKIILNAEDGVTITNLYSAFDMSKVEEITLNVDTSHVTNSALCFRACPNLYKINGTPLDLSSCTRAEQFLQDLPKLEYIRFAKNSINIDFSWHYFTATSLSNESIISFANALDAGSHTLQLYSTFNKNRFDAIVGSVIDGIFVEGAGAKTLSQFVIDKGWTIT